MRIDSKIERLVWDDWNRAHIGKHAVEIQEVEETAVRQSIRKLTYKGRLMLIGSTVAGRMISIIVGPVPDQPGSFYVFSARPASRTERLRYERETGGAQQ